MRLKKIKLSGFKSFVDPTTIPINGNILGVVGPNGCGKSNIIDAVRWVMGESSAKHLRGDSMADVIFNGSTARKPVGKASVELIFDNSDGTAPGQYATYSEIAIRREAGRDGQSDYFLNKTRCRRKDITDIFLGTGLGPRAYSIIEQGMVTRIIEAKPEDLRAFFEEAAGISRYKERRRETENRIRHTRENLSRVEDVRKELTTQLGRLQRQSKAAEKYKEYKQQERLLRAQLLSLRWQDLTQRVEAQDRVLAGHEIALEAAIAEQRGIEAEIEQIRSQQAEASDKLSEVQAKFYALGADISNLEQAIQHARETREQLLREQEQVNRAWQEASQHLESDRGQLDRLKNAFESSEPHLIEGGKRRDAAATALASAETEMRAWQDSWEAFNAAAAEASKTRDIQRARIQQLEQQLAQLNEREARLAAEAESIAPASQQGDMQRLREEAGAKDRSCEEQEQRLEQLEELIKQLRADHEAATASLSQARGESQRAEARLASLNELQAAALGKHDAARNAWLHQRGLDQAPRLAAKLSVEEGWEKAVEQVLGGDLAAVCIPDLKAHADALSNLKESELTLIEAGSGEAAQTGKFTRLADKIDSDLDLNGLLAGVYVAETLDDALAMRPTLAPHESVVTRSGIWAGKNWLALSDQPNARAGMLEREREIERLGSEIERLHAEIRSSEARARELSERQHALEQERAERRKQLSDYQRERTEAHTRLGHKEAQIAQLTARAEQIHKEREENALLRQRADADVGDARSLLEGAEREAAGHDARRQSLNEQRASLQTALDNARRESQAAAEAFHQLQIERQGLQTALESTRQSVSRLEGQLKHLLERRGELETLLGSEEDEAAHQERLEVLLQQRLDVEVLLTEARKVASDLDASLRGREQARTQQERKIQELREVLERERVGRQELVVRRQTLEEQLREGGHQPVEVIAAIPEGVSDEVCHQQLEELTAKIERLGAINLVAIEEFQEQSQRKEFLDKQYEDLTSALGTLEEAIRKMDRETRTRFKETFDKVNENFKAFFPRLFGGGSAYLETTGEDLLETGVTVMARPPGKRNSTIHLLSGGEKALTAVALLFAIFELNPAPFCLLDEVDAPLDDANVERYSQTLKAMSERSQLIFITHNKITMEIADILLGVTMSEPGVSRLVAVDVEQALEMVAS